MNKPDIMEVVSEFIRLRKSGKGFMGLCPMPDHDDRNPSFYVDPGKQYYRCFGCGAHGDVIDFVMRMRGLTFKEALEYLGIEPSKRAPRTGKPRIKVLLEELKGVELEILYREILRRHSCLCSSWIRVYNRVIASKYNFWRDGPECIAEYLPELLKQCSDIEEVKRAMWWIEKAGEWKCELDVIRGGTQRERFELYREITGVKENI